MDKIRARDAVPGQKYTTESGARFEAIRHDTVHGVDMLIVKSATGVTSKMPHSFPLIPLGGGEGAQEPDAPATPGGPSGAEASTTHPEGSCSACGAVLRLQERVGEPETLVVEAHRAPDQSFCAGSGKPPGEAPEPAVPAEGRTFSHISLGDNTPNPDCVIHTPEPEAPQEPEPVELEPGPGYDPEIGWVDPTNWCGARSVKDRIAVLARCSTEAAMDALLALPDTKATLRGREARRHRGQLQRIGKKLEGLEREAAISMLEALEREDRVQGRPGVLADVRRRLAALRAPPEGSSPEPIPEPAPTMPEIPDADAALIYSLARRWETHIGEELRPGADQPLDADELHAVWSLATGRTEPSGCSHVLHLLFAWAASNLGPFPETSEELTERYQLLVGSPPAWPESKPKESEQPAEERRKDWVDLLADLTDQGVMEEVGRQINGLALIDAWVVMSRAGRSTAILEAIEDRWEDMTGEEWSRDPVAPAPEVEPMEQAEFREVSVAPEVEAVAREADATRPTVPIDIRASREAHGPQRADPPGPIAAHLRAFGQLLEALSAAREMGIRILIDTHPERSDADR